MNALRKVIVGLEMFVALTALVGGVLLVARPDGGLLHLDIALARGVFSSWLVPGILLACLGALQSTAAYVMLRGSRYDATLSAFAGAMLCIWIGAQVIFIGFASVHQLVMITVGFAIFSLAMDLVHEGHGPGWLPADDA